MKKIICLLLAAVTAFLCAACKRIQAPEDLQTTAPQTTEQPREEATTEPREWTQPLLITPAEPFDPDDRLAPTQEDLDRLCGLLSWGSFFGRDYDSDKSPVLDFIAAEGAVSFGLEAYDLLREGENYAYNDAMGEDVMRIGIDPRGYYPNGGYKKIRADVMEYYMENVFHNFTYADAREESEINSYVPDHVYTTGEYYYEDGWYYIKWNGRCNENIPVVREYETEQNGYYALTIDQIDAITMNRDVVYITIRVDATLARKDGRRLWTIYNTKVVYNRFSEENE